MQCQERIGISKTNSQRDESKASFCARARIFVFPTSVEGIVLCSTGLLHSRSEAHPWCLSLFTSKFSQWSRPVDTISHIFLILSSYLHQVSTPYLCYFNDLLTPLSSQIPPLQCCEVSHPRANFNHATSLLFGNFYWFPTL